MRIIKRESFFLIAILFGYTSVYSQTLADVKMGEILNNGDLFQIREQYPILKDSVSIEMLNLVSEAQLGIGFNQLERADVALDSLLQFHQAELGAETSIGMAALQGMNLLNLGMYEQAGKVGEGLVNALKNSVPFEALYSFVFIEKVGKALANVPKPYLERPDQDITVPSIVETVGRGKHIYIPVEVNGITKNYIFDTGCSFGNFVSEKYAEEVGLKVLADSIPVSGMEIGLGYDFIAPHTSKTLCLGTAHVDYLLNLTSLLEPDPDRRFHLIASLGTGIGWSNYNSDGGIGWVVEGGLQFRWNVSRSFDLFAEPSMTLWDDKLYDYIPNTHHFIGVGRISLGTAYRF